MKKVLHVGITAPTYSSEAISKSFIDVFGECIYFDWQAHRFNYGMEQMRTNLLKTAHDVKPDIIFLHFNHNNEALTVDNYKELSAIGFVISYTEDVREDISWFETITPLIGFSIFTNIDDVEKLKLKGINNAHYLPVSYNDLWYKKQPKTLKYYGDIVFLGNNYTGTNLDFPQAEQRQQMVLALKKEFGDKFQAYGNGQENKMLNPQEAVECYNNAKIAIGHNNFTRKGYQSDRCLNSIGCGCTTITQYIENEFLFSGTGNWKTIEHLISLCHGLIDVPEANNKLSEYQHEEVTENHTWYNRSLSIKNLIENNG